VLRGSVETGATVAFFNNALCQGSALASGTATAFATTGIQVTVGADTTTGLYVLATDVAGNSDEDLGSPRYGRPFPMPEILPTYQDRRIATRITGMTFERRESRQHINRGIEFHLAIV
jgi:hypothetical protein